MGERFRSMINDSQSPPRSANVAVLKPSSSNKEAVAVVMSGMTESQASALVVTQISSAVLSLATSILNTQRSLPVLHLCQQ